MRFALFCLLFPFAALAQEVVAPPVVDEVGLVLQLVTKSIETRQYILLVPAAVILIVMALRKFAPHPALKSDRGGALLTAGVSFVATVAAAMLSGHTLGLGLILSPLLTFLSVGAFVFTKKVAAPSDADPAFVPKSPADLIK